MLLLIATKYALGYLENLYLDKQDKKIKSQCVITNEELMNNEITTKPGNAGCLIIQDTKVILIEGAFSIDDLGRSGKILFPGGTKKPNEYSACTAARETFEETGIAVNIIDIVGVTDNGFIVFECTPVNKITPESLKYRKRFETRKVHLLTLDELNESSILKRFRHKDDKNFITQYITRKNIK
jgi:8-oxo-dGTP pyrophosphatase MutT (NUDIX family)